jgi:hypothetical protein
MSPNLSLPSQHKITVILLRLFGSAMQAHLTWQRSVNKEHKNRTSTFCCCVHILYNHITCISQQPKLLILPIEIHSLSKSVLRNLNPIATIRPSDFFLCNPGRTMFEKSAILDSNITSTPRAWGYTRYSFLQQSALTSWQLITETVCTTKSHTCQENLIRNPTNNL